MDYFDQIATGVRPPPAPSAAKPSTVDLQLSYALARQVPAMARGFTIATSFGGIEVVAGVLAERLQVLVREAIEHELAQRTAQ